MNVKQIKMAVVGVVGVIVLILMLVGCPVVTVPAGYTGDALPIGLGIIGPAAYTDGEVLGLAYAFEQATKFIRQPVHTPPLPGGTISVP